MTGSHTVRDRLVGEATCHSQMVPQKWALPKGVKEGQDESKPSDGRSALHSPNDRLRHQRLYIP